LKVNYRMEQMQFDLYKKHKNFLKFTKFSIKYELVLANDIWRVLFLKSTLSNLKSFLSFFFIPDFLIVKEEMLKNDVVFTSVTIVNRPDALEIVDGARKSINKSSAYIDINKIKRRTFFKLNNVFGSIQFVFQNVKDLSFSQKLNLSSKLASYQNSVAYLEKVFLNFDFSDKRYVAFHSSITWDSLLCQFFNSKHVPTYSLSHGVSYIIYKRYVPHDAIAAENISASKVLVWGNSSRRDLSKHYGFPIEKIAVSGNLKYPYKDLTPLTLFKSGLVLLGRHIYEESNAEILRIVSEFSRYSGCKITVRLHPSLSLEKYKVICKDQGLELIVNGETVNSTFQSGSYDFAIVNNSATYFEAMYYNCICFRYEPSENEIYTGLEDRFYDTTSLAEKIELFKKMNKNELKEAISNILVDNLGMGINRFSEHID
jgi:hypothetical protein